MFIPLPFNTTGGRLLNPANRNRLVDDAGNWFSWGGPESDGSARRLLTADGDQYVDELGNPWIWGVPSASGAIVTSIDPVALITDGSDTLVDHNDRVLTAW